ncbi:hypothetical protein IKG05_00035 [Candidatus Saccharibacteria bacterium]|nr:hypothetical protein [Candidatus Saccharibacteria bacterium]
MSQQKFRVYRRKFFDSEPYPREYWLMTPDELLQRVREDSERSDYNWITSAAELVHTCNQVGFPSEVAAKIKDLILNCFANMMNPGQMRGDRAAVFDCYTATKNEELRTRFLRGLVLGAMNRCYGNDIVWAFYHDADLEKTFMEQKLQELQAAEERASVSERYNVYVAWYNNLIKDYDKLLDQAEKEGKVGTRDWFLPADAFVY